MIMDVEFLYHLLYLLICALGLFVHEFFYSLLVGTRSALGTCCCPRACEVRLYLGVSYAACFLHCAGRLWRSLESLLQRRYGGGCGTPATTLLPVRVDKQSLFCSSPVYYTPSV